MARFLEESSIGLVKIRSIAAIALLLALSSCRTSESTQSTVDTALPFPPDFRLVIGEGGGFAGLWSGNTIDSSGTLFAWQGAMAEQNIRRVTTLKRSQVQELWQRIAGAKFFLIDTSGTGNVTQMMMVRANGISHQISWARPPGNQIGNSPAERLYDYCATFIGQQ